MVYFVRMTFGHISMHNQQLIEIMGQSNSGCAMDSSSLGVAVNHTAYLAARRDATPWCRSTFGGASRRFPENRIPCYLPFAHLSI
jgi:hypothetical protein